MHDLNSEQKKAINIVNGPILILAGAGSGKTRVLTQKIAHLITNKCYSHFVQQIQAKKLLSVCI